MTAARTIAPRTKHPFTAALTRGLAVIVLGVMTTACADTWFGEDEAPPLPGKRLSVMIHERQVSPDPEAAKLEILLPAPSPNKNWPQAGGYANHAMHHITVADNLAPAWDADAGSGSSESKKFVSSPIIANGRVFVLDSETAVSALDAANGNTLWRAELTPDAEDDDHIGGGLAHSDGHIFVTTGFGEVIALDATNGKTIWRKNIRSPMRAAPTVRGGRVFAIGIEGKLYALSTKDGSVLWDFAGISETASLLGSASPAVDAGVIVAPFSSGELIALKVETGRVLWADSLTFVRRTDVVSGISQIRGRPIIDRGRVFAVSHSGLMAAIDLRTGRRIWDKEIGGQVSPWIAGDYLFVLSNDSELIALSRDTGKVHWVTPLDRFEDPEDKSGPIFWTGPILASDRLIITSSRGDAYAVSPYSGAILGSIELPDGVSVPPAVANGSVYFLTDSADLVVYR